MRHHSCAQSVSSSAVHLLLVAALSIAWQVPQGRTSQAVVAAADESFEAVGVSWSSASNATVRVRVSDDRIEWSEWVTLAIDGDLTDESEGRYLSAITHFGAPRRYIEYSFSEPVDQVVLTMFPPSVAPPIPAAIAGA